LLVLASANDWSLFNDFVIKYEKRYDSLEELNNRFVIFKSTLVRIAERNAHNIRLGGEAIHGVTEFADLTQEEFKRTRLMRNLPYRAPNAIGDYNVTMPAATVDWRTKGVITPVKNQEQCGSCWAFSADEAVESFYALKSGNLQQLSAQQCAACTYTYNGCDGGWPHDAYINAIEARAGLELDSAYPYTSGNGNTGSCKLTNGKATNAVTDDSGYSSPTQGQLQNLLTNTGPVSVCVAAETWDSYTGGVMMDCGTGSVDHCVQAVGYNSDASQPYWLVRNSWGVTWGVQGYIYLSMTANNGDICHIQEYMTYPTISAVP
jgi:C1A family cysteine protease